MELKKFFEDKEARWIAFDFLCDMVKWPIIVFMSFYVSAYALMKAFIEFGPDMCGLIK